MPVAYAESIRTDKRNRLIVTGYRDDATGEPIKMELDGKWSLTDTYDLAFRSSAGEGRVSGKTIIMRGEIENVRGDAVMFRVRRYENISCERSGTITLSGRWKADANNRITFEAARSRGEYDTLTFQGGWELGQGNKIIYKYKKTQLKTKVKEERSFALEGAWKLGKKRIGYSVEGAPDSFLAFSADLVPGKMSLLGRFLPYEVDMSYRKEKKLHKVNSTISISGKWEITKDLKFVFCADSSAGRVARTEFTLSKYKRGKDSMSLSLEDKAGDTFTMRAELKKVLTKDAELFLALSRSGVESKIMGGGRFRF